MKDVDFIFDEGCEEAFDCLKNSLTTTPIIQAPDWTTPFELMCDASNYALGVVLAQRIDKQPRVDLRTLYGLTGLLTRHL